MFRVEDTSIDRMAAGESAFAANIVSGYGSYVKDDEAAVLGALSAGGTQEVNPDLGGISRTADGTFDPRPNAGSPALSGAVFNAEDNVTEVAYRGAFSNDDNWALGWTALDAYGYFGDLRVVGTTEYAANEHGVSLSITPNPIQDIATIRFELPAASEVSMNLYNISGKRVATNKYGRVGASENAMLLNTNTLPSGLYILAIQTEFGTVTQKVSVAK